MAEPFLVEMSSYEWKKSLNKWVNVYTMFDDYNVYVQIIFEC